MSVGTVRYCAMGERCSQHRFLGEPTKLRSTSESSVCEPCSKAGRAPQTFPTTSTGERDLSGSERCAACWSSSSELVEDEGEHVCETCGAVFHAARTLLDAGIDEETEIIPAMAFAKGAAQSRFLASRKRLAQMAADMGFWDWFARRFVEEFSGLRPVRVVDGVLVLRKVPAIVEVKKYPRTRFLRQVRIGVFSRSADPEDVAELYERALAAHDAPFHPCSRVSVSAEYAEPWLKITIDPDIVLRSDGARRLSRDPQKRGPVFPPPDVIRHLSKTYLGSVDRRSRGGYAYALEGRDRGKPMSARTLIPACVARYVGVDTAGGDDLTPRGNGASVPPESRARVAGVLNRHLLDPCGLDKLPQEGWRPDDTVWRNATKVAIPLLKAETLLLQDPMDK